MELTIEIKENGKLLETIPIDEEKWKASGSDTFETTYVHQWIAVPERWGYQLNAWLQRPPIDVREEHGGA